MKQVTKTRRRILASALAFLMAVMTLGNDISVYAASYGGTGNEIGYRVFSGGQIAQVFTAASAESLDSVNFSVYLEKDHTYNYSVDVYQNLTDATKPTSGTKTYTGTTTAVVDDTVTYTVNYYCNQDGCNALIISDTVASGADSSVPSMDAHIAAYHAGKTFDKWTLAGGGVATLTAVASNINAYATYLDGAVGAAPEEEPVGVQALEDDPVDEVPVDDPVGEVGDVPVVTEDTPVVEENNEASLGLGSTPIKNVAASTVIKVSGNKTINVPLSGINISKNETFSVVVTLMTDASSISFGHSTLNSGGAYYKAQNSGSFNSVKGNIISATTSAGSEGTGCQSVSLNPSKKAMAVGEALSLNTSYTPTGRRFNSTYSTDVANIVTVDDDGLVTALNPGSVTVTATCGGKTATVKLYVIKSTGPADQTYDGSALTPVVSLTCDAALSSSDYTMTPDTFTEAGTHSFTVTGNGVYSGYSEEKEFTIEKAVIDQSMVDAGSYTIDTSSNTVTAATISTLNFEDDFTATAKLKSSTETTMTYEISVSGVGNYTTTANKVLTVTKTVTASAVNPIDIGTLFSAKIVGNHTYTGSAITPTADLKFYSTTTKKEVTTVSSSNYSITWSNNTDAGKATATIKGINQYKGEITANFTIAPCNLQDSSIEAVFTNGEKFVRTGSAIEPDVKLTMNLGGGSSNDLVLGKDYIRGTASNNVDIGTQASIRFTGTGNYTGYKTVFFEIIPDFEQDIIVNIEGETSTDFAALYKSSYSTEYTGAAIEPYVEVKKITGGPLSKGSDYTVSYQNNTNVTTDAKIVLTGIGDYAGRTVTVSFEITPIDLYTDGLLTISQSDRFYNGSAQPLASTEYEVTVAGNKLTPKKDFDIDYTPNDGSAGTAIVKIKGKGNYTGEMTGSMLIQKYSMKSSVANSLITVDTIDDQSYTGLDIEAEPVVKFNGKTLTKGTDYTLEYNGSDYHNIGEKTVTIKAKSDGNFVDSRDVTYNIVAKSLTKLSFSVGNTTAVTEVNGKITSNYSVLYDGDVKEPAIVVKDGNTTLKEGVDYTKDYASNLNAGDAYIIVRGLGGYNGSVANVYFTIEKKNLETLKAGNNLNITYSGNRPANAEGKILPKLTITDKTVNVPADPKLVLDKDYELIAGDECKTAGEGKTVTIRGKGNYQGEIPSAEYIIGSKIAEGDIATKISLSNPYTSAVYSDKNSSDQYRVSYLGNNVKPNVAVKYNNNAITLNTDYTVEYTLKSGQGLYDGGSVVDVKITGKGDFFGTKTVSYYVEPVVITNLTITDKSATKVNIGGTDYFVLEYDGTEKKSNIEVKYSPDPGDTSKDITLVKDQDYTITEALGNTNANQTFQIRVTGAGNNYTGNAYVNYKIGLADISSTRFTVDTTNLTDKYYTGSQITPPITIKDTAVNNKVLDPDNDYDIVYSSNTAIGTATVTITGKNNYTGTRVYNFNIVARPIDTVIIDPIDTVIYDGTAKEPTPTISYGGKILTKDVDYTLSYADNTNPSKSNAKVEVTGKGTFTGTKTVYFSIKLSLLESYNQIEIKPTKVANLSDVNYSLNSAGKITVDSTDFQLKNKAIPGTPLLAAGTDYEVTLQDCEEPGTGYIIFTGKDNSIYTDFRKIPIKVYGNLANATVKGIDDVYYYKESPIKPAPTQVTLNGKVLSSSSDYELEYSADTTNVGVATVKIKPKAGNTLLTGEWTKTYKIKYNLNDVTVSGYQTTVNYDGTAKEPTVTVKYKNTELSSSTDYDVEYLNNTNAGKASIVIKPHDADRAEGQKTVTFDIKKLSISTAEVEAIADDVYDGTAKKPEPKVTVDNGATELVKGVHYNLSYENNTDASTSTNKAKVIVTGINNYDGTTTKEFNIEQASIDSTDFDITVGDATYAGGEEVYPSILVVYKPAGSNRNIELGEDDYTLLLSNNKNVSDSASVKITGKGNYKGSVTKTFKVEPCDLENGTVDISDTTAIYTGKKITPTITVKCPLGNGQNYTLKKDIDYTMTGAENIMAIGDYTITITGKNGFTKSREITFTVEPQDVDPAINGDNLEYTISDEPYDNGNPVTPSTFTIYDVTRDDYLVEGTDYKVVRIINNTDAASKDDENAPTVQIKGLGNYTGTYNVKFSIGDELSNTKAEIYLYEDARHTKSVNNQTSYFYDGKDKIPYSIVKEKATGKTLVEGTDYEIIQPADTVDAGDVVYTIKGKGNYYGTVTATYHINQKVVPDGDEDDVFLFEFVGMRRADDGYYHITYSGKDVCPEIKVYDTEINKRNTHYELRAGIDYEVSYDNNKKISTNGNLASACITLKGNYAQGANTVAEHFYIDAMSIADEDFIIEVLNGDETRYEYDGAAQQISVKVTRKNPDGDNWVLSESIDDGETGDYIITYEKPLNSAAEVDHTACVKAGSHTLYVNAINNYSGCVPVEFTIYTNLEKAAENVFETEEKAALRGYKAVDGDEFIVVANQAYAGVGQRVEAPVTIYAGGNKLVEGVDYDITYKSDDDFTESGYALITPKKRYYYYKNTSVGSPVQYDLRVEYQIEFDDDLIEVSNYKDEYEYTGTPVKPDFVYKTTGGKDIVADSVSISYERNGISTNDLTSVGEITAKITLKLEEKRANKTVTYKIVQKPITSCARNNFVQTYNYDGKTHNISSISYANGQIRLVEGVDYIVSGNEPKKEQGEYVVQVTGIGNYSGTEDWHYVIVAPRVTNLRANSITTKKATIIWDANPAFAGYEVWNSSQKKCVKKTAGTSYSLKNLKQATSYTYYVRGYYKINGAVVYSPMEIITIITSIENPKNFAVSSSIKKKVNISWAKNSSVKGYEIWRSSSKNGEYELIKTVNSAKKTSWINIKLPSKTKYYYKVRCYKDFNGQRVYSGFSKVKGVKVK